MSCRTEISRGGNSVTVVVVAASSKSFVPSQSVSTSNAAAELTRRIQAPEARSVADQRSNWAAPFVPITAKANSAAATSLLNVQVNTAFVSSRSTNHNPEGKFV